MNRKAQLSTIILLLLLGGGTLAQQNAQQDEWDGVDNIVAIGDIHGDYPNYMEALRQAGLVNSEGNWQAGDTHFVQLGDLPDRGPDSARIMRHMQQLEQQATQDGGKVHALIGNHELLNMLDDLRYVHPGEYKALRGPDTSQLQENYFQQYMDYLEVQGEAPDVDDDYREEWNQRFPLGYVEHRIAWSPEGEFGSWVLQHNTVIRINNILFLHAGMGPEMPNLSISRINNEVRAELSGTKAPHLVDLEDGPLWYRGLARNDEAKESRNLRRIQRRYNVDYIVIGHTPGLKTILPRFDGHVFVVDSGISDYYGGHPASLHFENGTIYSRQYGQDFAMPANIEQSIDYFRNILQASDSDNIPLQSYLDELEATQE